MYVFPEMKLHSRVPNSYIYIPVSGSLPILLKQIDRLILGAFKSLTEIYTNMEIKRQNIIRLFWK
jgi:hypothetical protein